MRHEVRNCQNCYVSYAYQSSGSGCLATDNDPDFCPRCKSNIVDALARVPKTAEWTMIVIEGLERERVLEAQQRERENPSRTLFGLPIRRYGASLFKVRDGKTIATRHTDIITYNNVEYFIATWTDNSEPPQVSRRALRDLATGETRFAE